MSNKEHSFQIELRKTGPMEFTTKFDKDFPNLLFDEPLTSGGNDKYPNASRIFTASIANCLSASLTFCLSKTRIEIPDLNVVTKATCYISRNEDGYIRIKKINVEIFPSSSNYSKELIMALERCKDRFANYCVVSQSVKAGVNIEFVIK
ncbi:MAG: OsmC family protein [Candidatus Thorarchaeota archaeon]